ncbi:MAG: hypothetical protein KGZ77_18845 [Rhodobacteraceae bacterium]|nr:hypothetical protein [Paracoccaceae bacterium]
MSLDPDGHKDVTGRRNLTAIIRRYPCGRPVGATTARLDDRFKESARCTR